MLRPTIVASKVPPPALPALPSHPRERRAGRLHRHNQTKTIKRELLPNSCRMKSSARSEDIIADSLEEEDGRREVAKLVALTERMAGDGALARQLRHKFT